jgi:hypothetical protein
MAGACLDGGGGEKEGKEQKEEEDEEKKIRIERIWGIRGR